MGRKIRSERGTALLEAAVILPVLLLISVGIFEFGRAYQTWQILTNAAREGARMASLPNTDSATITARVRQYMEDGQLGEFAAAAVIVDPAATVVVNGAPVFASQVTVNYPFEFLVLQPVASLVSPSTNAGAPITMQARALMRNEAQ